MNWTDLTHLDYFSTLVADDRSFPLTEAAAALAQDESGGADVQGVLDAIDRLVLTLKAGLSGDASPLGRLRQLQRFFFRECGFAGYRHDEAPAAASCLHEVLQTRRGSAIALAVIYLEMATQIGLNAEGVLFPGRFVIRLGLPLGDVVLDPVDGQSLSREALVGLLEPYVGRAQADLPLESFLRPASPREMVGRLLRELEARYRRSEDWTRLLAAQQRLVALLPEEHGWRRDRGLTLAQLGRADEAIIDLADYLYQADPAAPDRARVAAQLRSLRTAARARWV